MSIEIFVLLTSRRRNQISSLAFISISPTRITSCSDKLNIDCSSETKITFYIAFGKEWEKEEVLGWTFSIISDSLVWFMFRVLSTRFSICNPNLFAKLSRMLQSAACYCHWLIHIMYFAIKIINKNTENL